LAMSLALATLLVVTNIGSVQAHHETTMVNDVPDPQELRTDGESIVWSQRGEEVFRELFVQNLDSGETAFIADGDIPAFDVSGDRVVWLDRATNTISIYRISTGENSFLAQNTVMWAHWRPVNIEGDWVVWVEFDEETRLVAHNLGTGDRFVIDRAESIRSRLGYTPSVGSPTLHGSDVYWRERTGSAPQDLLVQNLDTGQRDVLSEDDPRSFAITGDTLISIDGRFISANDLTTGEEQRITSHARQVALDGSGMVFWEERDSRGTQRFQSLHAWGIEQGEVLDLRLAHMSVPVNMAFTAEHGMLVWSGIHAVEIDRLRDGSNWRYFPETDRHVRFGLLDYWTNNGGIPVFGYPVTDQFDNAQFFERQRIEEHPQHLGTPYDVQLGLLGTEDAEIRGLLDSEPFQALPGDTGSDEHCQFFPETGHRVCHGFLGYWQSNGLDFGDDGVSFRESLALFGYPISEEYVDPETGLVTQYFQRARFEYHPENDAPWDILLGRLGADIVDRDGLPGGWPRE
jgi:hypothetical protein